MEPYFIADGAQERALNYARDRMKSRTSGEIRIVNAVGEVHRCGNRSPTSRSRATRLALFPQSAALQGKVRGGRMPIARTPKACPAPRPGPLLG